MIAIVSLQVIESNVATGKNNFNEGAISQEIVVFSVNCVVFRGNLERRSLSLGQLCILQRGDSVHCNRIRRGYSALNRIDFVICNRILRGYSALNRILERRLCTLSSTNGHLVLVVLPMVIWKQCTDGHSDSEAFPCEI